MSPESPNRRRARDPRLRQRDYLLRLSRSMSAILDPREVLGVTIRSAATMTGSGAGAILLDGPAGQAPHIVASHGLDEALARELRRAAAPRSAPGQDGEALVEDAGEDDGGQGRADGGRGAPESAAASEGGASGRATLAPPREEAGPGGRRMLTIPLPLRGGRSGRIVLLRSEGASVFTPLDGELLEAFAGQSAVALENALLHQRLALRERQLAAVVEHSPSGLLVLDADGRIVLANAAAERLLDEEREALAGGDARALLHLEDAAGRPLPLDLPTRPESGHSLRGRLATGDAEGRPARWLQVACTAMPDAEGELAGYVLSLTDLTEWREAESAKSAFLAGLSHELKTPLSLIRGFAETLGEPDMQADAAFRDQALDVILEETEHLTRMVDQLLLAARLDAGALALDLDELDLAGMLGRLRDEFAAAHPERTWALDADPDLGAIVADPTRLRQVFVELLGNAAKYAAPGTPVVIEARGLPGRQAVIVRIVDRGPGIEAEALPHLFERFYRAPGRRESAEGTGLGLYMARAIAEAHGGTITVASTPGRGSTIALRLPRRPGGAAAPRLAPPADGAGGAAWPSSDEQHEEGDE